MTIITMDDVVCGGGPGSPFYKASQTSKGAGYFHSLWKAGGTPGAGASPAAYNSGTGYTSDNTSAGALWWPGSPAGGQNSALILFSPTTTTVGQIILYDRLWACSGMVANVTDEQVITTPGALPSRDALGGTDGFGVEAWVEVYTDIGTSAATFTLSYTNTAGTSGRAATYSHQASSAIAGQMAPLLLQAGDYGVKVPYSVTLSGSTGTAGNFGITLLRKLGAVGVGVAPFAVPADIFRLGKPILYSGTCFGLMVSCSTTNTGQVFGSINWSTK